MNANISTEIPTVFNEYSFESNLAYHRQHKFDILIPSEIMRASQVSNSSSSLIDEILSQNSDQINNESHSLKKSFGVYNNWVKIISLPFSLFGNFISPIKVSDSTPKKFANLNVEAIECIDETNNLKSNFTNESYHQKFYELCKIYFDKKSLSSEILTDEEDAYSQIYVVDYLDKEMPLRSFREIRNEIMAKFKDDENQCQNKIRFALRLSRPE